MHFIKLITRQIQRIFHKLNKDKERQMNSKKKTQILINTQNTTNLYNPKQLQLSLKLKLRFYKSSLSFYKLKLRLKKLSFSFKNIYLSPWKNNYYL